MRNSEPPSATFGARLTEAMRRSGLTQRMLATKIRRSEGAVSRWVRGEREPNLSALARMATVLGVSLDWLVGVPAAAPPPKISRVDQRAVRRLVKALREAGEAGRQVAASMTDDAGDADDER